MEKLTAPKLPKNYRFKVVANYHKNYTAVLLQRKWLGIIWLDVEFRFVLYPSQAISVYDTMHQLIAEQLEHKPGPFDGYYPPREEL